MSFPVYLGPAAWGLHPHPVFEALAYFVGFRLYLVARRRQGDVLSEATRWWTIAAAIGGALVGSTVLYWVCDPALTATNWQNLGYLFGGKTMVGGLAGGLLGVELAKKALGVRQATGDMYAVPLAFGIAIGRMGCFLTGLSDRTQGLPTSLPWAVDFGDGIPRHPAPLYEVVAMLLLAAWLAWRGHRPHEMGACFRDFMVGYMAFRLVAECFKPGVALGPLTAIQWVCVAVLAYYALRSLQPRQTASERV